MRLQRLFYSLGVVMLVAAVVVILTPWWAPQDVNERVKSIPPLGIMIALAGVLVALAGQLLTQGRNMGEYLEKQSRFYLDSCIQAYDEAQKLLGDGNNDRGTWIAAARSLKHAKELSEKVVVNSHRRVLEVHELKYRRFFHDLLQGKPASFFYGVNDTTIATEEAARLSTAPQERDGGTVFPNDKLSERSLHAIWEAAQFPEEYRETLEREFSDEERGRLFVLYPELFEFLQHIRQYDSSAGTLYPRNKAT